MSHIMKLRKRIIEKRIGEETTIGEEQLGFMSGRSTTEVIIVLRKLLEKRRWKRLGVNTVFIDLKKAYDRALRHEIWQYIRKKNVPEKYMHIVKDIYDETRT